jgi:hypothetical protein
MFSGHCTCGAVVVEARALPKWVGICHCASCRRATGATSVTAAGFPRECVYIEGPTLASIASSPGVVRSFCSACGTSLSYQNRRWPEDVHLMVGALDEPGKLRPQFHIFFDERLPWSATSDDLPKYKSTPSEGILAASE